MGARKRNRANQLKEERQNKYYAVLRNCPTSPRKMRLVTDMIKGVEVNKALDMLKFSSKEASRKVEKLLLSAIANWQTKNEGARIEESNLVVKEAKVDAVQDPEKDSACSAGKGSPDQEAFKPCDHCD